MNKRITHILLIIGISIITYINIFPNKFTFDDYPLIVENYEIRSLPNIFHFSLLKQPIREITFALDYHFWELNPLGYHLTNLLLHIGCSLLIYFFLLYLVKDNMLPLFATLLFAAHPLHTEAVTAISNRKELLILLFILLSLLGYIKSKQKSKLRWLFYIGSILSFVLALGSKFVAMSLPFLLLLYECYAFHRVKNTCLPRRVGYLIPYFLIILIGGIFMALNYEKLFWMPKELEITGKLYFVFLLTMFKGLGTYFRLLVLPYNLCAEYAISAPSSVFEMVTLFPIIIFIALLFVMIKLWNTKYRILSFGIAWFFINFLPVSNLAPASYIVAERYMYVPSLGFCIILGYGLWTVKSNKLRYVLLTIILCIYCGLAIHRNSEWRNGYTLWTKTVKQSPGSAIVHLNLGVEYSKKGLYDLALSEYNEALRIYPFPQGYFNIGNSYFSRGMYEEAIQLYKNALEIDPNYNLAHYYLGVSYEKLGDIDSAILHYSKCLSEKDTDLSKWAKERLEKLKYPNM